MTANGMVRAHHEAASQIPSPRSADNSPQKVTVGVSLRDPRPCEMETDDSSRNRSQVRNPGGLTLNRDEPIQLVLYRPLPARNPEVNPARKYQDCSYVEERPDDLKRSAAAVHIEHIDL